jgi:hypothetical protein
MPNPWVFLRHDQLNPVNKAVNEKKQLETVLEEDEKKMPKKLCCFSTGRVIQTDCCHPNLLLEQFRLVW